MRWTLVVCLALLCEFRACRLNVTDVPRRTSAFDQMIINVAVHVSAARIHSARVFAAAVDASRIRRTIRVGPAAQKSASDPRITAKTRWTFANSLVIDSLTNCILATGWFGWRTCRNAVVLHTGVCSAALGVRMASDHFGAGHISVPVIASNARANGFVVGNDALGVRSASTRILADRVHASLVRRTIAISGAFDIQNWCGSSASSAATADIAARTHADHGSDRVSW